MAHRITLIPGDGIGPEITEAAIRVLETTGVGFEWESHEAGIRAYEKTGNPLPPVLLESIRRNKIALKGPLTTLVGEGFASANVTLRKELDLYANLRPVRSIEGVKSRYEDVNLVIVRENTEDLYSGIEHIIMPAVALGTGMMGLVMRVTRSSVLEIMDEDYVRTARAKGVGEAMVLRRHVLRNALVPIITVVGLELGTLLSGSIIVETVFAWPGVGTLILDAILKKDFPVVLAGVMLVAVGFIVVNLVLDLLYTVLDPRIRRA